MLRPSTSAAMQAADTPRTRGPRRRAESTRHRLDAAREVLHPNDLKLGQLFTRTHDAVVVTLADSGRIALWNPAAEQLFGWSAAQAVGQSLATLVSPAIARLHRSLGADRPFEISALTMRGEEIHVDVAIATLEEPRGPGGYVLVVMREASSRRRTESRSLELARIESARAESERTARRHALVVEDGIGDMRRELHRLRCSVQRLGKHVGPSDSRNFDVRLQVVEARSERLERKLDGLAVRSAIESNTLELHLERVNLVPLMSRVVARTRLRTQSHKLNAALPQGLTVLLDPERIEQAIQTLVDHALARCPRGCWIDVDLRRPLVGLARLEIRDFGRQASEQTRRRLAEGGGADRDLALVRSIVSLHGGTLSFEFPADGGVRAVVTLPTQRGRVAAGAP